jgi:hypothetical protein
MSAPSLAAVLILSSLGTPCLAAVLPVVSFVRGEGRLRILVDGKHFADYTQQDARISRPFLSNVLAPGGIPATRNHPPVPGKDATDHDTMHPGIWLAFGELGGQDYWRNRARVRPVKFLAGPQGGAGEGTFTVLNEYLTADAKQIVAREVCRLTLRVRPEGYLLLWDSTFTRGETECVFGDQEEMGLGVRLATPLTVKAGGRILNSDGKRNEREVWGKQADWCDYSGQRDGKRVGLLVMPDPANFRPSWFHSRDYGVLVANPFGRAAFTRGEKSRVVVPEGKPLRLRYGVLVYAAQDLDHPRVYRDFLAQLKALPD